jgi:GNAT superfamily N-acetyltransferase
MSLSFKIITGKEIEKHIPALAWLRISVFREFPYLYDGSETYEKEYLSTYLNSDLSIFVLAVDANNIVGAASAMPLKNETQEVRMPFEELGIDINDVFYFGESVLLKDYRGRGIGKVFMQEREKYAVKNHFKITAFCGVLRPENHPRRPADFRPLDAFWIKQGYQKQPEMITNFVWQDLDEEAATPKEMMFWLKYHSI